MLRFWLFFLSVLASANSFDWRNLPYKTIDTNSGPIRGRLNHTILKHQPFYAYKGIPFAKPPIHELRFKAPEPIDPWTETIDAFEYGPACPQHSSAVNYSDTREDCLFLNIFIPGVGNDGGTEAGNLPVMVFIFGGSFEKGTADDTTHGPDFIVEHGVILVTISYRIGVLGFMSLGTTDMSGNMGLKDQQLAMKWIYENIGYFGGDNMRITLSGHSAGSMSVGHHLFNDESQKYFQQMLCMSGVAIAIPTFQHGNHRCTMEIFANSFQHIENDEDLFAFLKNVSVDDLMKLTDKTDSLTDLTFAPLIESEDAIRPFILEDPIEHFSKLTSINKTAYFTFANREMLGIYSNYPNMTEINALLDDFHISLNIRDYNDSIYTKPYLKSTMNKLRDYYFESAFTDFEKADQMLILTGDILFFYYMENWVLRHASISQKDIFYQRFSVDSMLNAAKKSPFPGAGHDDEACYFFSCRKFRDKYKQIEIMKHIDENSKIAARTMEYMVLLVTNFVKYGNPSVTGLNPVQANPVQEINFLDVTNEGLVVGKSPNGDRLDFLGSIISETIRLVRAHDDSPTETWIQQQCDTLTFDDEEQCIP